MAWRIGLAILAAAGSPALAKPPPPMAPCNAIAQAARAEAVRPATANRAIDLERLLPPVIGTPQPASEDPALLAAATRLFDASALDVIEVQPVAPGVWRAQSMQGTLHCTDDLFFRREAKGKTSLVRTPPSFDELCNTSWRAMRSGPLGPILVETETFSSPELGVDVEVTPWTGAWGPSCRASLRFKDSFTLTERFCHDRSICAAGAAAAPKLAALIARSGDRDPPGQTLAPMRYPEGRGALATFGAKAKTEFTDYSDTQRSLAVTIAERPVVAHVGIGGVGWRPIGDYLVTLYAPGDGDHPLAGYVVQRRAAGLKSAAVSEPKPWVNPH
jgi:hypothetical protein